MCVGGGCGVCLYVCVGVGEWVGVDVGGGGFLE